MEPMDCDSPGRSPNNSVSNSDSENRPQKKTRLIAKIKSVLFDKKNSMSSKRKNTFGNRSAQLLKEIEKNEGEYKGEKKKKKLQKFEIVHAQDSFASSSENEIEVFDDGSNKENFPVKDQPYKAEEADVSLQPFEDDICQEDLENLILMENIERASQNMPDSFKVRREQGTKSNDAPSVSDSEDKSNNVEEAMCADVETEFAEELKVSQDAEAKSRDRLKRLLQLSERNKQDQDFNEIDKEEFFKKVEKNPKSDKEATFTVTRFIDLGNGVFACEESFECDNRQEDLEEGFRSTDCNEFSDKLRIDNNDNDVDEPVPGCSKTPDKSACPPPPISLFMYQGFDSDSDPDSPPPVKKSRKESSSEVSDISDSDGEDGSIQALRKMNKKNFKKIIKNLRDKELEEKLNDPKLKSKKGKSLKYGSAPQKRRRGSDKDTPFRFKGIIPTEKRRSSRLQKTKPEYSYGVLDELHETRKQIYFKRPNYNLDDYLLEELGDLEKPVREPKRKSSGKRKVEEHVIIPVEEVTRQMLDNIALRVRGKVYSSDGTTCHQCRQKTMDQKTSCRSPNCSGLLGMFCGVCIRNRYGENAAEALLNPNWICPVCRGRCNCSICRTKQGKRPTGILAPLAQQSGYESVDHFLDTLNGEGDKPQDDDKYKLKRDPEALIGFSEDGRQAYLQDGSSHPLLCSLCALKDCDNPDNLLGFSKDGNIAIMGGQKEELLFKPKIHFLSLLHLKQV